MASSEERAVAVIMVGGPTKGTNIPKPFFPLAGQPMVLHPISACKRIPNLVQIYLIGFYEEREFALLVSSISNELRVPVRYLKEDKPHGSAGGLYNFRDLIMEENPHIFLLNCDVCSSFPLLEMLEAHRRYGGIGTILVIKVSAESAYQFGELVADPDTKELLHYTEKPETFVSDRINCGVYVFSPGIFTAIQGVSTQRKERATLRRVTSFEALQPANRSLPTDFVRLDQDILSPLAGKKQFYVYETLDFWEQIKTPGMSLRCSGLYLAQYRFTSPHLLASGDGSKNPTISGDVFIHPCAKVHPTAKSNARIGAGARLVSCIILDDVEIQQDGVAAGAGGDRHRRREGRAGEVRDGLHSRFLSATEPGLKNIYGVIEDLFHNIHVMLVLAADDLQKRNYGHLASKGGGVRDYADRSAAAIEKDAPELKQKNEDVGVLGEAVAVIAKDLS
ncbi:hypothetical protein OROMI_029295 [Orobanche minor]